MQLADGIIRRSAHLLKIILNIGDDKIVVRFRDKEWWAAVVVRKRSREDGQLEVQYRWSIPAIRTFDLRKTARRTRGDWRAHQTPPIQHEHCACCRVALAVEYSNG